MKNSHIEDDLILVIKKQTPTVKVITVRLRFIRCACCTHDPFVRQGGRKEGKGREGGREERREGRKVGKKARKN